MASYADAPLSSGALSRPASDSLFSGLVERFARWREYRRTLAELESLDLRTLRDMGLTHGDIRRVARDAAGF